MEKTSKIYIAWHNGLVWTAIIRRLTQQWYTNLLMRSRSELDLLDGRSVRAFFEAEKPEYVILTAAKVWWAWVNAAFPFEMLYENMQIQNNVIGAAFYYDVKKLIFIASSTIYPSACHQPIGEWELLWWPLDPLHESYGLAKISGLKLCEKIRKQTWREFITLAPTNIYGVWDHFEETRAHVIWALMTRFHHAKISGLREVSVWWTGAALREFLYVDDLALAIQFFLEHTVDADVINIGTDQEVSIRDLADTVSEIVWYTGAIVFDTTKPEWRLRRKLDTTLADSLWWKASISFVDWLSQTYQYFLSIQ